MERSLRGLLTVNKWQGTIRAAVATGTSVAEVDGLAEMDGSTEIDESLEVDGEEEVDDKGSIPLCRVI